MYGAATVDCAPRWRAYTDQMLAWSWWDACTAATQRCSCASRQRDIPCVYAPPRCTVTVARHTQGADSQPSGRTDSRSCHKATAGYRLTAISQGNCRVPTHGHHTSVHRSRHGVHSLWCVDGDDGHLYQRQQPGTRMAGAGRTQGTCRAQYCHCTLATYCTTAQCTITHGSF